MLPSFVTTEPAELTDVDNHRVSLKLPIAKYLIIGVHTLNLLCNPQDLDD